VVIWTCRQKWSCFAFCLAFGGSFMAFPYIVPPLERLCGKHSLLPIGIMTIAALAVDTIAAFLTWKYSPYVYAYIVQHLNDE